MSLAANFLLLNARNSSSMDVLCSTLQKFYYKNHLLHIHFEKKAVTVRHKFLRATPYFFEPKRVIMHIAPMLKE